MNHNVYILGAGFSRDAGFPLISDFKDKMIEANYWLVSNGRDKEARAISNVLEFRRTASSACERIIINPDNIEDLFSLSSAYDSQLIEDVIISISATLDYCNTKYLESDHQSSFGINQIIENGVTRRISNEIRTIYGKYASLMLGEHYRQDVKNTIITFNYDTLLEEGIREIGLNPNYDTDDLAENDVRFIKLHGSLNWGEDELYDNYSELFSDEKVPVLIPPTWNKSFINDRLKSAWNFALPALQDASRVIIIGFSLPKTDIHFKFLLAAGLMGNILLKEIIIVNPDIESVKQNVSEIFTYETQQKIKYVANTSEEYIINSDEMKKIDRLDKDIQIS